MESTAAAAPVTADQLYLSPRRGRCCACVPRPSAQATKAWNVGSQAVAMLKEWSEVVPGPRLKALLRRMGRGQRISGGGGGRFRYDPISYALNFDDGVGKVGDTRSPAAAEKSAMDRKTVSDR